jgi:hypothetical protein
VANNKKEKRRINPFDVVVILLVLVLIATFAYRLYAGIAEDDDSDYIKYVMEFECENEYNSLIDYLSEGDEVYFAATGELLGYLYVGDIDEGAIFEIVDDIPTFASEDFEEMESSSEPSDSSSTEAVSSEVTEEVATSDDKIYYHLSRLGGYLRLNYDTFRVSRGNYYTVGDVNFTVGSVIEVYTEKTVFTIKVVEIELVEK